LVNADKVDETAVARGKLEPQKDIKEEVYLTDTFHIDAKDAVKARKILINFNSKQIQDRVEQL